MFVSESAVLCCGLSAVKRLLTSHVADLNVQLQRVTNLQTRSTYVNKNKSVAAADRKTPYFVTKVGLVQ